VLYGQRERPGSGHAHARLDGGCCTKRSAKTWAGRAVTVAEVARSAEDEQSAPRVSHDLRLFRPRPQERFSEPARGLCNSCVVSLCLLIGECSRPVAFIASPQGEWRRRRGGGVRRPVRVRSAAG